MNKLHVIIAFIAGLAILATLAATIPVASRTVTQECPFAPEPARTIRYSMLRGHDVNDIETSSRSQTGQACSTEETHILYIL